MTRIATYNVNGINGRLANLVGWLQKAAPDIMCLQELRAPDDKFPAAVLRTAGYGAVWHGQKSWNGVAILARGAEPVETRRSPPGDRMIRIAATSRRPSAACSSDARICRTAIRRRARNSITSCACSNG